MAKCPQCGKAVTSDPTKKWRYSGRDASHFVCSYCGQGFILYETWTGKEYTIPKKVRAK